MRARDAARTLAAMAVAALLGACAAAEPVPEDRYYRIEAPAPERTFATSPLGQVVAVERFSADGLTAGRPILYVEAERPQEVKEYHYHFWTDPPGVMLRDRMVAFLRQSEAAPRIVTPEMRVEPDYTVSGRIRRLERVLDSPARVVADLELGLRRHADGRLLVLDGYRAEVAQEGEGVAQAVQAFDAVVADIYRRFLADVAAAVR